MDLENQQSNLSDKSSHWPEKRISSWKEFLEFIGSLNLEKDLIPKWSFRGQSNNTWKLEPSLMRVIKRYGIDRVIGHKFELSIFKEFISTSHFHKVFKSPKGQKEVLLSWSMLQHYGAPTRVLDWTTSPAISLYYAVNENFESDGAIFIFNSEILGRQCINIEDPESIITDQDSDEMMEVITMVETKRSKSQQGTFTFAANIDKNHCGLIHKKLAKINTQYGQSWHCKLIIDSKMKLSALSHLRTMNIKPDILYPDLFGYGQSLKDLLEIRGWLCSTYKNNLNPPGLFSSL